MQQQRIIAVHLLNDLSGSPCVFAQALRLLVQQQYEIHLFTATPAGKGFLSGLPAVKQHPLSYSWRRNKMLTLLFYLASQGSLLFRLLYFLRRGDIVYINSILPFGAALAGRIRGCKVVYHIHEVSIRPQLLKKWLLAVVNATAVHCIYVSRYCYQKTPVVSPGTVVYNTLPAAFVYKARNHSCFRPDPFTVLMACSLKRYKGVEEFVACARILPAIQFELVLNASDPQIKTFFSGSPLPPNLKIYPAQPEMHAFYSRASLVVNLSHPAQWIETFGMTVLEAMYYGRPVIVPPMGGVTELVEDGVQGFWVDSSNLSELEDTIQLLYANHSIYERMSQASIEKARFFSGAGFDKSLSAIFLELTGSRKGIGKVIKSYI